MRRLAACALLLGLLAGCREHTVSLSFRPEAGATYRYEVRVEARTTTRLEGRPAERKEEEVRLLAEHTVLESNARGVRIRVLVGEPGTAAQAFVVRFNRAAQLESIETVEGDAPDVAGALGVPEIFPGGAGGPPGRRLAPGERWEASREVLLPLATEPSRLRVEGRLVELGLSGGEEVARITSTARLPIATASPSTGGLVVLDGEQVIRQRATFDLDDGAVRHVRASTRGAFDIEVQPPPGTLAEPVPGSLRVEVTSTTRRLPDVPAPG